MGDDALKKAMAENERRSRAMTEGMQSGGQYGAKPPPEGVGSTDPLDERESTSVDTLDENEKGVSLTDTPDAERPPPE